MPRNPIAALIQFPLGLLLASAGILALGWAVTTHFEVRSGFDAFLWVAEHSPIAFPAAPVELANAAIQQGSLIAIGVAGFFLWLIGSGLMRAARANMRPASATAEAAPPAYTPVSASTSAQHAGSTVFARGMLSEHPSAAHSARPRSPDMAPARAARPAIAPHVEREADLEGFARLIGKDGRFTPQQREALAKLTPEQRAALAKFSKWAPSRKNAVIALVALFVAFQVLPSIFSLIKNR